MFKILKNLKPLEWLFITISVGFIVLQVWLDLKMPEYMGEITTLVQTPGSKMSDILSAGGMMLGLTFASVCASVIVAVFAAKIGSNLSARLRLQLYDKVQSFTLEEINKFSISSLITRSTNDISQVQAFIIMGLQIIIKSPILAVWAIAKIITNGWQWSLTIGIAVALLIVVAVIFMMFVVPKYKRMQKEVDEITRTSRESLTGIRVVRAYNAEKFQEAKFNKTNRQLAKTNLYTNRMMSFLIPVVDIIFNGVVLAIYVIGAFMINTAVDKIIIFSDMMVFVLYATQLLMAFMMMFMVMIYLPSAAVGAKRINEVLSTQPIMKEGKLTVVNGGGEVEFRNVSFKYPGAQDYVIKDINFRATKGETVAFIGSTGSGKSTLINLIPRFFDVSEGAILIDGVDIKDYTYELLHSKIGYVSQKAKLFAGTLESNISFGTTVHGKPTPDMISQAVEVSQSGEFVANIDEGINGYVAPGGSNLSGGQKQRVSIARAIARNADIMIFDDSFSALDYKTDRALRSALKLHNSDTTLLIVAQRIGTIKNADKIIVLEDGLIVGTGTHQELMENCDVYREIAYSQLNKEELE